MSTSAAAVTKAFYYLVKTIEASVVIIAIHGEVYSVPSDQFLQTPPIIYTVSDCDPDPGIELSHGPVCTNEH